MSDVPTALADLVLPDATGRSHRLGDLWADRTEEREAYRAAALVRSARSTFNLQTLRAGARATGAGFRQGRTQGDPWQQGGVFVIHPGGRVTLAHVSQHAGDHPEPADVIRAAG